MNPNQYSYTHRFSTMFTNSASSAFNCRNIKFSSGKEKLQNSCLKSLAGLFVSIFLPDFPGFLGVNSRNSILDMF